MGEGQGLSVGSVSMTTNSELATQGKGGAGVNRKTNLAEKVREIFSSCHECHGI